MPAPIAGLSGITRLAVGSNGLIALKNDGTVWACGSAADPANGLPRQLSGLSGIVNVAMTDFSPDGIALETTWFAIDGSGQVWSFGGNTFGQLGRGTVGVADPTPGLVAGITGVVEEVVAFFSVYARTSDGKVWGWGKNDLGLLGRETGGLDMVAPGLVPGITTAKALAVGERHSLALLQDGSVVAWGYNTFGQLGDGTRTYRLLPAPVAGLSGVDAIAASVNASYARKADGSVYAWGRNRQSANSETLGDGTYVDRALPAVVFREGGAGNLESNDWFLDLRPGVPSTIPLADTPKVLAVAEGGADGVVNVDARVTYRISDTGKNVGIFVMGVVPPSFLSQVPLAPGTSKRAVSLAKADGSGYLLVQLTPAGWSVVTGPLSAIVQGIASGVSEAQNILKNVAASTIPGARFCIGYAEGASVLLQDAALREVLQVPGATGMSSEVGPCVFTGTYLTGPSHSSAGTPVTFTASVVGAAPSGNVQLSDNAVPGATQALAGATDAISSTAFTLASLGSGPHALAAAYAGDTGNPASGSDTLLHTVAARAATTVSLAGPASTQAGSSVTFTATVSGGTPTGSVRFRANGIELGMAAIQSGVASAAAAGLAAGSYSITADYDGDGATAPSTATMPFTVNALAPLALSLQSSAAVSYEGLPVTLTATLAGGLAPGGAIRFVGDAGPLGLVLPSGGVAQLTLATLPRGLAMLRAEFDGDAQNPYVSSLPLLVNVRPALTAGDSDADGIPDAVEVAEGTDPFARDNDVFSPTLASARLFAMQQYRDFVNREADPFGLDVLVQRGVHGNLDAAGGDRRLPQLAGVRGVRGAGGAALLRHLPARAGLRGPHLQCGAGAERHGDAHATGGLLHGEPGVRRALRGAGQHAVRHAPLRERAGAGAGSGGAFGMGGVARRRLHARAGAAGLLGFRRVPGGDGERGVRDDDVFGDASPHGGAHGLHRMAELPRRGHFHARAGDQRVLPLDRVPRSLPAVDHPHPRPLSQGRGEKRSPRVEGREVLSTGAGREVPLLPTGEGLGMRGAACSIH